MRAVAVLGAGNMGTALAQTIAGNGHHVRLWSIESDVLEEVRDHRTNSRFLAGVPLHDRIAPSWTVDEALRDAELAVFAVPSHVARSLARDVAPCLRDEQKVLNVGKGLEDSTDKRLSEVLIEELGGPGRIASMGGPAIAPEFARGTPTAVIVAAEDPGLSSDLQALLQNTFFKVERTSDVAGVEVCATLKNAYAIALGMCDGLGHSGNTKAFLASLALDEMAALSTALGGELRTAYGLAGLGDLITTGYNARSRNRTLGEKMCGGPGWRDYMRSRTVEGVSACRAARDLAHRVHVATPLLHAIYDTLFLEEPPRETMRVFLRDFGYH